jgi:gliding motility-associated-like protein
MFQALRFPLLALLCLSVSYGIGQVPLINFPDLTSITFHEQSGAIYQHTYGVNDGELTTHLPGQLNGGNRDFEGVANREFYDVFYSDADGSFNSNGGFVSVECRYDFGTGGGALNINEVEFHFGSGYSLFGCYVTSYVGNGNTYVPGSEEWAADCNLVTLSAMGNTENTTIRLRVTIGMLDPASTIIEETCSGSGYEVMVGNSLFNETNPMGTEVLTASNGCDSLVYVDLTFNEVYAQEIHYNGCSGDGYAVVVGNTTYNENNPSGIEMLTTQDNCDSTIVVDLVFNPVYENEIIYQGCEGDGYSLNINGTVYNEANPDGTEIFMTSAGCDSVINIELAFYPVYTADVTYISCSGSGYEVVINGVTYDEDNPSGTEWMSTTAGCDSIIHIDLTFLQTSSQVISYAGCSGDGYSIVVNGTNYNEANPIGQEILTTVDGCDSIINVSLAFLPAFTVNEFHSACMGSGFSLIINGTLYDELNPSGVEVFTSQGGCDSIVNIQLDFLAVGMGTASYAGCSGDGYSVTVNGTIYDELNPSGVEMLTAQNGCDSIVTINLIFQNSVSVTHSYTGCTGDGYAVVINGNVYNEANPNGIEVIPGSMGCDTVVTIDLTFQPVRSASINYIGCEGDGYEVMVNGTIYNASNPQGTEILTAQNGCDSVITISLSFLAGTQHAIQYTGCVGDNYSILVNGTLYDEMNPTGTELLTGSNGCDSLVTVNLAFNTQFVANENYSGCAGDGYFIIVNGNLYDEQHPMGTESISGVSGCDTLVEIELTYAPSSFSSIAYAGCSGDGYTVMVNGVVYDESNPFGTEYLVSTAGCDSVIDVALTFAAGYDTLISYLGCTGDGYTMVVNGTIYDEQDPIGIESMTTAYGCDSTVTVAMSFADVDSITFSYTGCMGDGYAVTINGSTYNESNPTGIEMMQTVYGCDSIIQVALIYEDCDTQDLDCAIFIPNVISPNDDGINDVFSFDYAASCEVTGFRITLYDRWGSELYSSTDPFFMWRGDFKGKQLQPGVFVYVAEINFKDDLTPVIRRGDVTLVW